MSGIKSATQRSSLPQAGGKTARFSQVIASCGEPEAFDLWSAPDESRGFMEAVRQNRVMSIRQSSNATDFGVVGFVQGKKISYMIFPKPLDKFADQRIVGIKYELVRLAAPAGPLVKPGKSKPEIHLLRPDFSDRKAPPLAKDNEEKAPRVTPPKLKRFRVVTEFAATKRITTEIEAKSKKEAVGRAREEQIQPDFTGVPVNRKLISVSAV